MRTLIGAACALTLAAATPAAAALLTFNTSDSEFTPGVFNQGWWSDGLNNVTSNDNYYVGTNGSVTRQLRDFFTFDLSSLNLTGQTVVSATLQATRFNVASDQNGETLGLFDVSTPAATLNANNGTSATIFNDLGTGAQYGSFFVSTTGNSND